MSNPNSQSQGKIALSIGFGPEEPSTTNQKGRKEELNAPNKLRIRDLKVTEMLYKIGPAGSLVGEQSEFDEKGRTEIVQIIVSYGRHIHSIQFQYLENGALILSPIFGRTNFNSSGFRVVKLDHPREYITGICGSYGSCVEHMIIYTNKRYYDSFGTRSYDKEAKEFSYQFGSENQFAGFHGSYDSLFLKSIGLYFKPLTSIGASLTNTSHVSRQYKDRRSHDGGGDNDENDDEYISEDVY